MPFCVTRSRCLTTLTTAAPSVPVSDLQPDERGQAHFKAPDEDWHSYIVNLVANAFNAGPLQAVEEHSEEMSEKQRRHAEP